MLKKIIKNSTSSYNSGTSSETSETQSVEENNSVGSGTTTNAESRTLNNTNTKLLKSWKRMKDANNDKDSDNKQRPPWRSVSVSTLPKPDKNAILRAKLLDASRRLRAGKISVSVQADIEPTKLFREINLGVQTDLILYKEIGVLTDGSYMKRKDGYDEFILTYSVSQMTDAITYEEASTQTLLPRVPGDDFMDAYLRGGIEAFKPPNHRNSNFFQFNENERKILDHKQKLSKTKSTKDELTSTCNLNDDLATRLSGATYRPSLLKPTLASWRFDFEDLIGEAAKNFRPFILNASKSWSGFMPQKYELPIHYFGNQLIDWTMLFVSVDELIQESNRLVDIIEELTAKKKMNLNIKKVIEFQESKFKPTVTEFPADHWLPIVEEQEKKLMGMVKNLKNFEIRKFDEV